MTTVSETLLFNSWSEVVAAVNLENGVMVCTMENLRDIEGYGRLGQTVRANIAKKLATLGLAFMRKELPAEASADIILYRQGTPVSELIEMIQTVLAGGMNNAPEIAESLRRLNVMPDPESVRQGLEMALTALDTGRESQRERIVSVTTA